MKLASLNSLQERIRNLHPRTRKAQLNIAKSLFVKSLSFLISFLLVPLTIDYLSKETYGTWLTISSVITMLTFLDIGIGSGLRNKLSEAVSKQDNLLARIYISTAYLVFGLIQLVFVLFFLLFFRFVPWQKLFNTTIDNSQLEVIVLITFIAVAIKLVLDILNYCLFALQESGQAGLINLASNLLILVSTYLLVSFTDSNLILLAIVTALSPIVVLLISSYVLYRTQLKNYLPSLRLANFKYAKSLLSLGYKFFIIQIAVVVVFYADNLIITHLFGPAEVTVYNVAFRYFNAATTIFAIMTSPYWSAFTEASVKNDIEWMQRTYSFLKKLWVGLVIVLAGMVILAEPVYTVWIGSRVAVPTSLNVCMGVFIAISGWNSISATIINGLGKVQIQLYLSLIATFINVPLAIYFGKYLNLGAAGVVLATSVSQVMNSVICGIQASKLIKRQASGIWDA